MNIILDEEASTTDAAVLAAAEAAHQAKTNELHTKLRNSLALATDIAVAIDPQPTDLEKSLAAKRADDARRQAKSRQKREDDNRALVADATKRAEAAEAALKLATAEIPVNKAVQDEMAALVEQNKVLSATIAQLIAAPLTPALPFSAPILMPSQQAKPLKPAPVPESEPPIAKPSPLALVMAALAALWTRWRS